MSEDSQREDHLLVPGPAGFPWRAAVRGPEGTAALGARVATLLRGGEIILLHGELGAGKTCFAQGLGRGLGVAAEVISPTFTLVNTYRGRLTLHHLDFYRVPRQADLRDIGVPDVLDQVEDGAAVAVVEWPALLLPALQGLPYAEWLACPGPRPDERIWRARGVPCLPPGWEGLFDVDEHDDHEGG